MRKPKILHNDINREDGAQVNSLININEERLEQSCIVCERKPAHCFQSVMRSTYELVPFCSRCFKEWTDYSKSELGTNPKNGIYDCTSLLDKWLLSTKEVVQFT